MAFEGIVLLLFMKINLTTYHGNCDIVNVTTQPNLPHFQLDASQLAE